MKTLNYRWLRSQWCVTRLEKRRAAVECLWTKPSTRKALHIGRITQSSHEISIPFMSLAALGERKRTHACLSLFRKWTLRMTLLICKKFLDNSTQSVVRHERFVRNLEYWRWNSAPLLGYDSRVYNTFLIAFWNYDSVSISTPPSWRDARYDDGGSTITHTLFQPTEQSWGCEKRAHSRSTRPLRRFRLCLPQQLLYHTMQYRWHSQPGPAAYHTPLNHSSSWLSICYPSASSTLTSVSTSTRPGCHC